MKFKELTDILNKSDKSKIDHDLSELVTNILKKQADEINEDGFNIQLSFLLQRGMKAEDILDELNNIREEHNKLQK